MVPAKQRSSLEIDSELRSKPWFQQRLQDLLVTVPVPGQMGGARSFEAAQRLTASARPSVAREGKKPLMTYPWRPPSTRRVGPQRCGMRGFSSI